MNSYKVLHTRHFKSTSRPRTETHARHATSDAVLHEANYSGEGVEESHFSNHCFPREEHLFSYCSRTPTTPSSSTLSPALSSRQSDIPPEDITLCCHQCWASYFKRVMHYLLLVTVISKELVISQYYCLRLVRHYTTFTLLLHTFTKITGNMDLVFTIDLLVLNSAHYTSGGDVVWHND